MKIKQPFCPTCGDMLIGTVDTIMGVARLGFMPPDQIPTPDEKPTPDSEWDWTGDTDICWDTQENDDNDEGTLVTCGEHDWRTEITQ